MQTEHMTDINSINCVMNAASRQKFLQKNNAAEHPKYGREKCCN
nr:hypothetical protein [Wolbachia endosymbiont of Drosophila burlai]